ncbi:flagellar hook-basal body complex protein [Pseudomonas putida]|jgi:flagellar hook protein FlgE|uniref:Flagellar hook protein FlgE n=1 Tax=Pseudomonas putida TaxID=303 RepID=A0A1Y3LJ15_PSEPU|nr:flagellar hook-basal body complex protein [Pseudomonas putida]MBH3416570.1 flagellar hook-basal body complex protein [Pseudomonas putida]MDG9814859.1 flagellar hook-basal body complex protein [Pseudomonas putida]OUM35103.1 flagellar basal body FlaE [Pseudomonas putida]
MSFNIGLSGLYAANKQLDVTGNNISNVNTTGFKSSRAEFADVYAGSNRLGVGKNQVGNGVRLAAISQQFTQGDINTTGNVLDLGIQGQGFFVLSDNGSRVYTRAGAFEADKNNFVVTSDGLRLQGYAADSAGNIRKGNLTDLKIDTSALQPKATSLIDQGINLNSSAASIPFQVYDNSTPPTMAAFDPADPSTYQRSTTSTVEDADGNAHTMEQFYRKTGTNEWTMYTLIDGRNPLDPASTTPLTGRIQYNSDGTIDSMVSDTAGYTVQGGGFTIAGWVPAAQDAATGDWGASGVAGTAQDQSITSPALVANKPFDPSDETTYSRSFPTSVYDSQGNEHTLEQFYRKTGTNQWTMYTLIDGRNPMDPSSTTPLTGTINFNSDGSVNSMTADSTGLPAGTSFTVANNTFSMVGWIPASQDASGNWSANGSVGDAAGIKMSMASTTSYNTETARMSQSQDGFATGILSNLSIDSTGVLFATFSNGKSRAIGQVALASFANEQGLQQIGGTRWTETYNSGIPGIDSPKTGTLGAIESNSLEGSNVNLTQELVELIKAQSNYQANAKTISTESTIMQTIIQMA